MSIFDWFRRRAPDGLSGCWHLRRTDGVPPTADDEELEFRGGTLVTSRRHGASWKVTRRRYKLDGEILEFANGSQFGFALEPDGRLRLDSAAGCAWYERGPKKAPRR